MRLDQLRWGFPPPKPKAGPVINFRSENRRFTHGRCLVPATHFFEFTGTKYPKTKWRCTVAGEEVFCIAGLVRDDRFTLLTCEPGPDIAPLHDRQVVILEPADWKEWLTSETPTPGAAASAAGRPDRGRAGVPTGGPLRRLRRVPERVHLGQVRRVRRRAARRKFRLDVLEAADELGVGAAQRRLRVDVEFARQVGADEEHVAQFVARLVDVAGGHLGLQLGDLLVQLGQHLGRRRPDEADARGALATASRRGSARAGRPARRRAGWPAGGAALAARSSALIVSQARVCSADVAMARRSPNTCGWRRTILSLIASATAAKSNAPCSSAMRAWNTTCSSRSPSSSLRSAEVAALDGVGDLVGLLDRVGRDGGEGLLQVPRAAAVRRAQPRHDLDQAEDRVRRRQRRHGHVGELRWARGGWALSIAPCRRRPEQTHRWTIPTLFHFSEDPTIEVFEPRPVRVPSARPPGRDVAERSAGVGDR